MNKDFMTLATERYSVRQFSEKPIEAQTLDLILRAGQAAPTACNYQPQRIICVKSQEALEHLRKSTKCHFGCTAAMIVCYDRDVCWKRPYDGKASGDIDAAIVTTHMMLEAESLGVGTTWVMHFDPAALRREFQLPENLEPTAILVMGYPAPEAEPNPRHWERLAIEKTVLEKM